ncbi:hypothetical protein X798_03946 [Onchocerca flexuosa]|uniref:Sulfur globule protein CV1 domain protein n=2 Tax=Onchocerca flexuosa TaxID=387005 RepID=A0A183H0Q5_9BILA|nr:hypothetical protein X798_03946 [Onchocerca flexuosa]VDO28103.1 unnamed protein product [Onchocerca flexuosa]
MLRILSAFIIVIMAIMASAQPFHSDPEMRDSVDRTIRVKRQWGDMYSFKVKTPFFKIKVKRPYPYVGGYGYGYGYGPVGYGPVGYHGYDPAFHGPIGFFG